MYCGDLPAFFITFNERVRTNSAYQELWAEQWQPHMLQHLQIKDSGSDVGWGTTLIKSAQHMPEVRGMLSVKITL